MSNVIAIHNAVNERCWQGGFEVGAPTREGVRLPKVVGIPAGGQGLQPERRDS